MTYGRRWRLTIVALACVVGVLVGATSIARPVRPSQHPRETPTPDGPLLSHDGRSFAIERLIGKTVVLNFVFTSCPKVCPLQTQALRRVRRALPDRIRQRVHFVSISIDPERDTPEILAAFAARQGVDLAHWTFVTGSRTALAALARNYSAQALPEGAAPLDHRTEVRLIAADGKLVQTYTGAPLDEPRLVREIAAVDRLFSPHASR